MTQIPEDIMKAAHDTAMKFGNVVDAKESMSWLHLVDQEKLAHIIAAALIAEREAAMLKERERCASLAEQRFTHDSVLKTTKGVPYQEGQAAIYAAKAIAERIRKGTPND